MRTLRICLCILTLALCSTAALAWHIDGYVLCDSNKNSQVDGQDLPLAGAIIHITGPGYAQDAIADANGYYYAKLLDDPACYTATLDPTSVPADAKVVIPTNPFLFCTDSTTFEIAQNWLIDSATCQAGLCWLTGGGTKYEPLTNSYLAEKGTKVTFGGNIHPGCSETAGAGGDWNHIDRKLKLHFHGTDIPTVTCGNVVGIPPGSESPKTPFNYLEATGTGWVKGLQGNKADFPLVYFFARYEDHNEPGSNGAKDGSLIDKIFLRVYLNPADPIGTTLILLDDNGGGPEVDSTLISTGNLQIHISGCDKPPLQ